MNYPFEIEMEMRVKTMDFLKFSSLSLNNFSADIPNEIPSTTNAMEESIGLYNTTTDGSKHCVFDQTNSHHSSKSATDVVRDPTVMLTSPQKLPKTILLRPRDALCIPQNQLMEDSILVPWMLKSPLTYVLK